LEEEELRELQKLEKDRLEMQAAFELEQKKIKVRYLFLCILDAI
jgi:hypothetical protein